MNAALRRNLRLLLTVLAVVYALLACLRTVADFDSGWHLATGRYVLQHHTVPATDILSYTSPGAPWHYVPFAGVLLDLIYQAAGYAGLSWFCALAAALLAAYLLWRALPQSSVVPALLVALAVPSLAYRLTPRADLFTTLFFALYLVELWRFHCGRSAHLWLLPAVMLLWVNLHPGFVAGLGVLAAYLLLELLQLPFADLRPAAAARLRRAWLWLMAAALAVFVNPYGAAVLAQARVLAGLGGAAAPASSGSPHMVGELSAQPLSWHLLAQGFQLRDPDSAFCWLMLAASLAILAALRRREFGAALLLGISLAAAVQKLRYQGLFAIVAVVLGATLLSSAAEELATRRPRAGSLLQCGGAALAVLLCILTGLHMADLVSNRYYVVSASTSVFGPGESWWFPERAAAFIEREKLPGNLFQPYNLGGFTALRLGPAYPDYIDGRLVSGQLSAEEQALMAQPPDSPLWQQTADQRGINLILLPLGRYGALGTFDLPAFCNASQWRPVYLDEVSIVLLRRTAGNQPSLDRLALDCAKAPLTPPAQLSHIELYNFYANSGAVFYALARDSEAEAAWQHALALEPTDPNLHLFLAQLYQQQQRPAEAEAEYRAALSRRQSPAAWYALGRLLAGEHRYPEAAEAIARAAAMSIAPANQYKALGQVQLHLNPSAALASFLKAEHSGPASSDTSPMARDFRLQLNDGRAAAYLALNNAAQATHYAEEAIAQAPDARRWGRLADCYAAQGRAADSAQARVRAQQLTAPQQP